MAFIPIPNGASLCFNFESFGQHWQFCFTIRKSAGAPTTTDLSNLTQIGEDWFDDHLKGLMDSTTSLKSVIATDQTSQGAPQHVRLENIAGSGGDTNPLPLHTAIVVSLRTEKRGRSYRGRTYIGGIPTDYQSDGVAVTSGYLTNLAADMATLQSALDTAGFDLVVPTRQHNGAVVSPAELNEVTGFVIDSLFDSQRRRLSGRGT